MFDGDVVFKRLSPGFEYVVSVQRGGGHEQQFDPFAALFESLETLPFFRLHTPRFVPIEKARPMGRAFVFPEICSLYPEYQIGRGEPERGSHFIFRMISAS